MFMQSIQYKLKKSLFTATLLALVTTACANPSSLSPDTNESHQVTWLSGYTMPQFLSTPIALNKKSDLDKVLAAPWYTSVTLVGAKTSGELSVNKCSHYLSEATLDTRTLREYENSAFLELAMMCRATELLLNAKKSEISNIPSDFLNASLPNKLPTGLAFQVSTAEAEINANDKAKRYWSDINDELQFKAISKDQAEFYQDGGTQTLAVVGKGDFNNDGMEDVLITSRDTVSGGNYFNLRLFALSLNTKNEWSLIKQYLY